MWNLERRGWIRKRYWQRLLLVFELNARLLFWIKYDLGVLSLLFHRQLSRSGAGSPCQHAFGFLSLSHRLDFSLGELFWETAKQRTNFRSLLLLTYSTVWQTATVYTNGTFGFESFIVTRKKNGGFHSDWKVPSSICPCEAIKNQKHRISMFFPLQ